jgi:chaperonin GroES
MKPQNNTVMLRPIDLAEKTSGGIILAETSRKRSNEGIVHSVGPGSMVDGVLVPIDLRPGDRVLYLRFGYGLSVDGMHLYAVTDRDILAVLEEDESAVFTGIAIDQYEKEELLGKEQ